MALYRIELGECLENAWRMKHSFQLNEEWRFFRYKWYVFNTLCWVKLYYMRIEWMAWNEIEWMYENGSWISFGFVWLCVFVCMCAFDWGMSLILCIHIEHSHTHTSPQRHKIPKEETENGEGLFLSGEQWRDDIDLSYRMYLFFRSLVSSLPQMGTHICAEHLFNL